jgi:hypothetical protein
LNKFIPTEYKKRQEKKEKLKTKWAKFTYNAKETKLITRFFKNSDLKISHKTEYTVGKRSTRNKNNYNSNKFYK